MHLYNDKLRVDIGLVVTCGWNVSSEFQIWISNGQILCMRNVNCYWSNVYRKSKRIAPTHVCINKSMNKSFVLDPSGWYFDCHINFPKNGIHEYKITFTEYPRTHASNHSTTQTCRRRTLFTWQNSTQSIDDLRQYGFVLK